jgi:hypothetical protein
MLRLCSESSCPYPGRSVCHEGCSFPGEISGGGNRYLKVLASSGKNWPGISVYPGLQSCKLSSQVKNLQKKMGLTY